MPKKQQKKRVDKQRGLPKSLRGVLGELEQDFQVYVGNLEKRKLTDRGKWTKKKKNKLLKAYVEQKVANILKDPKYQQALKHKSFVISLINIYSPHLPETGSPLLKYFKKYFASKKKKGL